MENVKTIFLDWQEDSKPLGVARLIKETKQGDPFILKEQKEAHTVVYNYKIWEVEFLELTALGDSIVHSEKKKFPIRYVDAIGIKSSSEPVDLKTSTITDKFLKVMINGKDTEIF